MSFGSRSASYQSMKVSRLATSSLIYRSTFIIFWQKIESLFLSVSLFVVANFLLKKIMVHTFAHCKMAHRFVPRWVLAPNPEHQIQSAIG